MVTVKKRQRYVKQNDMRLKLRKYLHHVSQVVGFFCLDSPRRYLCCYLVRYRRVVLNYQHLIHFFASFRFLFNISGSVGDLFRYLRNKFVKRH